MRVPRACQGATVLAGALVWAEPAHAGEKVGLEIGLEVGAATAPSATDFEGLTPFGFGLGGRVGASFYAVYLGLAAHYYFGSSKSLMGGRESAHALMEGLDAGYTFRLPGVILRPQVGGGTAGLTTSYAEGAFTSTQNNLYLEPELVVLVPLGLFFVGADAGVLILPGFVQSGGSVTVGDLHPTATDFSFTAHAQVGVRF
jgi:hypothetical protein